MLDGLPLAPAISTSFGIVVLWAGAWLVITRRLTWHTDLKREQARGDKWEGIALRALGVAEKMTSHTEAVTEVLTAIPIPSPQTPDAAPPPEGSGP